MISVNWLITLAALCAAAQDSTSAAPPRPAAAETKQSAAASPRKSTHVSVFRREIKNRRASDVFNGVTAMFGGRFYMDAGGNAILGALPDEQLAELDKAISLLDTPTDGDSGPEVVTYSAKHRSAEDMVRRVHELVGPGNGDSAARIAADDSRSLVLFSAGRQTREQIMQLLAAMDQPAPSVQLEFTLLCAGAASAERSDPDALLTRATPLPADLKAVGQQLATLGEVRLLGRCATAASGERPFSVRGAIAGRYELEIEGAVTQCRGADSIQVQFSAEMSGPGKPPLVFKIKTTADLKAGESLVLGAAPVGATPGESVAIVLRARESGVAK